MVALSRTLAGLLREQVTLWPAISRWNPFASGTCPGFSVILRRCTGR
jgi:hypothetical protein